jgi:hypothetical protein
MVSAYDEYIEKRRNDLARNTPKTRERTTIVVTRKLRIRKLQSDAKDE